jgi:hypothetical protein
MNKTTGWIPRDHLLRDHQAPAEFLRDLDYYN